MRTNRLWIVLLLAFFVAAAGATCPSSAQAAASDSWPQFQYGPTHSGFNPRETTLSSENVAGLSTAWVQPLGQPVYTTPVPHGDYVFVAGFYGTFSAYARSDGREVWTTDFGLPMTTATPLVYGSLVIAAGGDWGTGGMVAAYDLRTGQRRWATPVPSGVDVSFPVLYGGRLYMGAEGSVYALSAATGEILWSRFLRGGWYSGISGPVAVSEGGQYVVAATADGYLYGVGRAGGEIAWSTKLGNGVWGGGAAISRGVGYIANSDPSGGYGFRLYAFEVGTGRVLWDQECGDDVHVTPTVGDGVVYVGAINGTMHAFDAGTGAVRWVADYLGEVWSSPALANGVLYAGTEYGVVVLDADTGQELWRRDVTEGFMNMSSPAVAQGQLYMGSGEGNVWVFGLAD